MYNFDWMTAVQPVLWINIKAGHGDFKYSLIAYSPKPISNRLHTTQSYICVCVCLSRSSIVYRRIYYTLS